MNFNNIGLITNSKDDATKKALIELVDYLQTSNHQIILDRCCASLLEKPQFAVYEAKTLGQYCDLAIVIGGDGTMLMASHFLSDFDIPLLGINLGHIGFLADIPADNIVHHLAQILNDHYVEDERFLLKGQLFRDDQCIYECDAFNDVVIQKWNIARLVQLETYINQAFVHRHRSDGMIIASPTGSTAYALASGGPIVHPTLDALLLVPICPHSLTNRPIVVDGNSLIEVVVVTQEIDHTRLIFDGEIKQTLAPGDRITIQKKDKKIRLIHPKGHDQFHILREKLHWSK